MFFMGGGIMKLSSIRDIFFGKLFFAVAPFLIVSR